MFVKICGLRNEEHVQIAVDAGADAVGFVFAKSVRRISPARAASISSKVSGIVRKVAVMLHPSNEEWQEVLQAFTPDVLQTDAEDFSNLDVPAGVECWPVYREGNRVSGTFGVGSGVPDTYLYEGARSGSGEAVDWAGAAKIAEHGNMILAGGLGVANVAQAISVARPFGVDVSSGVETAPGRKDSGLIRDFISAAKAAGNNL
jgi:phosphoribosylanthranilate isomerase